MPLRSLEQDYWTILGQSIGQELIIVKSSKKAEEANNMKKNLIVAVIAILAIVLLFAAYVGGAKSQTPQPQNIKVELVLPTLHPNVQEPLQVNLNEGGAQLFLKQPTSTAKPKKVVETTEDEEQTLKELNSRPVYNPDGPRQYHVRDLGNTIWILEGFEARLIVIKLLDVKAQAILAACIKIDPNNDNIASQPAVQDGSYKCIDMENEAYINKLIKEGYHIGDLKEGIHLDVVQPVTDQLLWDLGYQPLDESINLHHENIKAAETPETQPKKVK